MLIMHVVYQAKKVNNEFQEDLKSDFKSKSLIAKITLFMSSVIGQLTCRLFNQSLRI